MSQIEEQFKTHNVHQALSDFIGALESYEPDTSEIEVLEFFHRFKHCGRYIQELLERAIIELVSLSLLTDWANNITQSTNEIRAYISDKDVAHLHSANSTVENLLRLITHLPVLGNKQVANGLNKLIADLTQESHKYIASLKRQVDTQEKRLSTIEQTAGGQEQNLQALAGQITQQKNHLDGIAANFQSQFSQAQEERSKAFHEGIQRQTENFDLKKTEFDNTFKNFIAEAEKQKEEQTDQISKEATILLKELQNTKIKAAELLKITSDIVITGNFKNIADKERRTANALRILAIICMSGVAIVAVLSSIVHLTDQSNATDFWLGTIYRLPVSLVLLIPAFYAARESGKHRKNEFWNRQLELKLASIDPYLASIDEAKQEEIKIELTKHFFTDNDGGQYKKEESDKDVIVVTKDVLKVAKDFIAVFKK